MTKLERPTYRVRELILPFLLAPLTSLAMNVLAGLVAGLVGGHLEDTLQFALFVGIVTTLISYVATLVTAPIALRVSSDRLEGVDRRLGAVVGAWVGSVPGFVIGISSSSLTALGLWSGLGAAYGAASGFVFVWLLPARPKLHDQLARIAARELALQEMSR